jgi:hypothetical protein
VGCGAGRVNLSCRFSATQNIRLSGDAPDDAGAKRGPVAVVDGKIAENLHIVSFRALIFRAGAIAAAAAS